MRFSILGAGNTGKAYSAYLSELGHDVVLYDRDPQRLIPIANHGIQAAGAVNGTFFVSVTSGLEECSDSDAILVCTVAAGHRPLAKGLKGLLRPGQIILVTNCCWGGVEFDLELGGEAEEKDCPICEMGGQLILCNSPAPEAVFLKTVKERMALSCVRADDMERVMEVMGSIFPQLYPVSSVLETSLNQANPISHGPLALFNITRIENEEDFLLFGTGATKRVTHFMEKIDQERVAVIRACGLPAPTELEMLNSFWPQPQKSIYDVLHNTKAYSVTKGPKSLDHRYFTEDLPYGLVPYVRLGKKLGVETPCLTTLIKIIGLYLDQDYMRQGPEVEILDLSRYG